MRVLQLVNPRLKRLLRPKLRLVAPDPQRVWLAKQSPLKRAEAAASTDLSAVLAAKRGRNGLRLVALLVIVLAACSSSGGSDPAKVVEQYLTAKVAADEETMRGLLCSAMEGDLRRESTSFASVEAKLDGMSCQRQGESDVVVCTGKIVATYGTEDTEFPLSSYQVVQEDGQWKWCGEGG